MSLADLPDEAEIERLKKLVQDGPGAISYESIFLTLMLTKQLYGFTIVCVQFVRRKKRNVFTNALLG